MRVNLNELYRETITIINKLDAKDAALRQDAWYKTVLRDCMWSARTVRAVSADGTVAVGTSIRVQIPENADYVPYAEWSKPANRDARFTIRAGDYIIRGEVAEEITPSNVRKIVADHEPDACQVKAFADLTKRAGIHRGVMPLGRFAEVLSIEGA